MSAPPEASGVVPSPEVCVSLWRRRFGFLTAASTLALIFIGGLVTSTGSALAVPDWPLSYGMVFPPMVGGVLFEHGHRMAAAAVGMLTLILAVWTARAESRRWVRNLAWAALAAVVLQGVLGGLTVLFLLPRPISITHACLAQTFFCILIALAYATSREWLGAGPRPEDGRGLRAAAFLAMGAVYVQLVLGAVMRHMGAGLAIPTFPLAFGRLLPPLDSAAVAVHLAHRVWAVVVLAAIVRLWVRCERSDDPRYVHPARVLGLLVLVQIGLGAAAVLSSRAVLPTTAHVATGAAILGGSWFLVLRTHRHLRPMGRTLGSGAPIGAPIGA